MTTQLNDIRVKPPAVMRKSEVAEVCGVAECTVHMWIKDFGLPARQVGKHSAVMILRRDLFKFLRTR